MKKILITGGPVHKKISLLIPSLLDITISDNTTGRVA